MPIEVIDTHQHLILPDRLPYSWPDTIDALANRPFDYGDYLEASRDTGIDRTIFMEADSDDWKAETEIVLGMVADPETKMSAVIANCRPEIDDGFDEWLERVADTDVVGLRRILHQTTDDVSESDVFRRNLKKLAGRGLTFDINFLARQLPIAADLLRAVDDVPFILDHCGVPDIAAGEIDGWRKGIETLAGFPHVACKISGITAYCAPGTVSVDTLRPYIEHCIERFGWDRVVWGSDWPVCNIHSSLREWMMITREVVGKEDPSNQEKLFRLNAERIYGLGRH